MLCFSGEDRFQFFLTVSRPQSPKPDESFLPYTFHRCEFSALDLISLLFQFFQKFFVTARLVRKDAVNHTAQLIAVAFFWRVKYTLLPLPVGLYFNRRQAVFQANQVTQPLHGQPRQQKVPEFTAAVQSRRVIDNVIVNMLPVGVRSNQKSILAFCKAHRQLITYFVGFFSGDFSGFEGLPNLICNHVIFLSAPCNKFVLPLGQHKFFIYSQGAAFITAYKLPLLRFIQVLCIVGAAFQASRNRLFPCFYAAQSAVLRPLQTTPIKKKAARRRHIIHQD